MPTTYDAMKQATAQLYEWSLRKVPDDTLDALRRAQETETNEVARKTITSTSPASPRRSAPVAGRRWRSSPSQCWSRSRSTSWTAC
jgi:hypothetical protein